MRFRPSGLSLRLRGVVAEEGFLLPFGRPGAARGAGDAVPARSARACCNCEIWASISAIMRLTSTCYLQLASVDRVAQAIPSTLDDLTTTIQNELVSCK